MAESIASLLDRAKDMHRLSSDYKLALVMGVSHRTLASYRHGMTLPDARVIAKICELTGDDPDVMAAQMEAQRATSEEARALWSRVAQRLQAAGATAVFAVAFFVAGMVGFPSDAQAKTAFTSPLQLLYIVECWKGVCTALFRALVSPAVCYLGRLFTGGYRVPRAASIAAA